MTRKKNRHGTKLFGGNWFGNGSMVLCLCLHDDDKQLKEVYLWEHYNYLENSTCLWLTANAPVNYSTFRPKRSNQRFVVAKTVIKAVRQCLKMQCMNQKRKITSTTTIHSGSRSHSVNHSVQLCLIHLNLK